jgi:hypothetical protein
MSGGSEYQRLRTHLAFLRMGAAAEALPGALDRAAKDKLSHTAFLERLLASEEQVERPEASRPPAGTWHLTISYRSALILGRIPERYPGAKIVRVP